MTTISLERLPESLSTDRVGTDGMNALSKIPGIRDPQVIDEQDAHAVISYSLDAQMPLYDQLDAHLAGFGLRRVGSAG